MITGNFQGEKAAPLGRLTLRRNKGPFFSYNSKRMLRLAIQHSILLLWVDVPPNVSVLEPQYPMWQGRKMGSNGRKKGTRAP